MSIGQLFRVDIECYDDCRRSPSKQCLVQKLTDTRVRGRLCSRIQSTK